MFWILCLTEFSLGTVFLYTNCSISRHISEAASRAHLRLLTVSLLKRRGGRWKVECPEPVVHTFRIKYVSIYPQITCKQIEYENTEIKDHKKFKIFKTISGRWIWNENTSFWFMEIKIYLFGKYKRRKGNTSSRSDVFQEVNLHRHLKWAIIYNYCSSC